MWKRIHSNRNPKDTLYSELHREFRPYFSAADQNIRGVLSRKPKWTWGLMTLLLTGSVVLSFTIFRQHTDSRMQAAQATDVSAGFRQLMSTTAKLRKTIRLKRVIDSLSANSHLSGADSAALGQALDSLSVLQQSLTHFKHEH